MITRYMCVYFIIINAQCHANSRSHRAQSTVWCDLPRCAVKTQRQLLAQTPTATYSFHRNSTKRSSNQSIIQNSSMISDRAQVLCLSAPQGFPRKPHRMNTRRIEKPETRFTFEARNQPLMPHDRKSTFRNAFRAFIWTLFFFTSFSMFVESRVPASLK